MIEKPPTFKSSEFTYGKNPAAVRKQKYPSG